MTFLKSIQNSNFYIDQINNLKLSAQPALPKRLKNKPKPITCENFQISS